MKKVLVEIVSATLLGLAVSGCVSSPGQNYTPRDYHNRGSTTSTPNYPNPPPVFPPLNPTAPRLPPPVFP